MRNQRPRRAFSLVEILIVIGILAMLISILLPTLAKTREAANRTACAANLRNWGYAAHAFAAEHKGQFPPAYRHPYLGVPFPSVLKVDDVGYSGISGPGDLRTWRRHGVSFEVMARYGLQRGELPDPHALDCYVADVDPAGVVGSNLICPSSESPILAMAPPELLYDNVVWGHYMYVGGLRAETFPAGVPEQTRWSGKAPAVAVNDKDLPRRVLAADEVYFSGGQTYAWYQLSRSRINHVRPTSVRRTDELGRSGPAPDWQNILYGDGHVEGVSGRTAYAGPLHEDNYTVYHWFNGAYFYWGEGGENPNDETRNPNE